MTAYYNEHDPFAAAWLRELIDAGEIAPGVVDERDVRDVCPSDLDDFTQCHFFAGIGGWSLAMRLAGWPDDRPVWTGSCPCQPFSAAGKGGGFADERHLWPAFFHLINQCRPATVFGEQVASKDGLQWLDLVQADLEVAGYALGAADLCAAGVGAPHIRQRLWFVAHAKGGRRGRELGSFRPEAEAGLRAMARQGHGHALGRHGAHDGLADGLSSRLEGRDVGAMGLECAPLERSGEAGTVGDPSGERRREARPTGFDPWCAEMPTRPGHWSNLEWLPCRDGKSRPTQSRLQPLAYGIWPSMVGSSAPYLSPLATTQRNRPGMLRGAGNAIVPQVAAEFILSSRGME